MTDYELLRQYVEGSQAAFTALLHFDLVHSAAMRQLRDGHAAEDICQRVFLILAKKSNSIRPGTPLAPWLYNAARYACLDAIKQRQRRERYERKAADMATRAKDPPDAGLPHNSVWENVEPVLDDAMSRLSGSDRRLLLMRFWESRSMEEVAGALDVSVDAAKKRVSRAVERLRGQLARSGAVVRPELLPAVLIANVIEPVPAGLCLKTAAAVSSCAGATVGAAGVLKGAVTVMAWTKAKILTAGLVGLCLVGGSAYVVSTQMHTTREVVLSTSGSQPTGAVTTVDVPPSGIAAAWRVRFEQTYHLEPGQLVKRVPPPFIPERNAYWKSEVKDMAKMMPDTDGMWMKFGYDRQTHWQSAAVGKPSVGTALESAVGLRPYEIEGPIDPWSVPFPGDIVVREGAGREQKLSALTPLISAATGRTMNFQKQRVTRIAVVMTGEYHPVPARNKASGPYEPVDVSVDPTPGTQYTTSSSFEGFCGALELMLRMRVVDQRATKGPQMVTFRNNNVTPAVAADPPKLEALLSNLGRQTGLRLAVEPRELEVFVMTPAGQRAGTQPVVSDR